MQQEMTLGVHWPTRARSEDVLKAMEERGPGAPPVRIYLRFAKLPAWQVHFSGFLWMVGAFAIPKVSMVLSGEWAPHAGRDDTRASVKRSSGGKRRTTRGSVRLPARIAPGG